MSSTLASYHPAAENQRTTSGRQNSQNTPSLSHQNRGLEKPNTWFTGGLPTPPGTKAMTGVTVGTGISNYPTSHNYSSRHPLQDVTAAPSSQHRQSHPAPINTGYIQPDRSSGTAGLAVGTTVKNAGNLIASHLQIPESVNKSKGSLAEFATEITCLFWFETAKTLQCAEELPTDTPVDRGLVPDAIPSIGFRKWVTTILSTTQVGKNVILLALMFIYRLKKFNPTVSGKRGSEFRLLTIALMLGNKFLDDNTYTNKTWAEVSGISVTEIHIMEVEFLSNMRYDLFASESEWNQWKAKLGRFGSFYEKAAALPLVDESRSTGPVTPTTQSFPNKLPSPPSTHRSSSSYVPSGSSFSPHTTLPNPASNAPYLPRSPLRQPRIPSVDPFEHRKRSLDMSSELPPAKRMHYPTSGNGSIGGILTPISGHPSSASVPPMNNPDGPDFSGDVPRLPMPRIPATNSNVGNQLAPLSLPGSRAMSTVYPTTTNQWSQPITPISAIPSNLYQNPIPTLGDVSRQHSNFGSSHTSPNGYSTTPVFPGLSPSYFLTNRSSPYRPVRHVNTLLIPPPSAALQNSSRNVTHDQMYYQPLSKGPTDMRTGLVPFHHPEGWHQSNTSTPLAQQYHYRP